MSLTYALNSLNRSLGQSDMYPFVLSPTVMDKLSFVHEVIKQAGDTQTDNTLLSCFVTEKLLKLGRWAVVRGHLSVAGRRCFPQNQ